MVSGIDNLQTPCLLLDANVMQRNIDRVRAAAARHRVTLRPHVKTPKALEVALRHGGEAGPITVSTLSEAETFAAAGFTDILYATTLSPGKVTRVERMLARGVQVLCLVDDCGVARALAEARKGPRPLPVLVELNIDDHRAGVRPGAAFSALVQMLIEDPAFDLAGAMSYAGASYDTNPADRAALAEQHRAALVEAGAEITAAGGHPRVLSFGSTPALLAAETLDGVTEVRGGIYVFQDLFQAGIEACTVDDIALTVLTTVLGHQPDLNRLWIDAGGMALSKDRSTAGRPFDARYGLALTAEGAMTNLWVADVHQELGMVTTRDGSPVDFAAVLPGTMLRILPNHSDMTAAAYDRYHVIDGGELTAVWHRQNGW